MLTRFLLDWNFALQPGDIVYGIRKTYGGGESATEGYVWGACWGQGLLRGAREALACSPKEGYLGHYHQIARVAKGFSKSRYMVSTRRTGNVVGHAEIS